MGRIQSYFRQGSQAGPILAEVRPLKSLQNGTLISCAALVEVTPENFLEKADILAIR